MKYPDILWDKEKCKTPFDCKRCLQICPQAVFSVRPVKQVKFKETDPKEPGSYFITPTYRDKCIICNRCIEVCPEKALKIIFE
ncbi:MAG: 4Fe-4S dicluster domain-containing protein [Bacillota bacterium]